MSSSSEDRVDIGGCRRDRLSFYSAVLFLQKNCRDASMKIRPTNSLYLIYSFLLSYSR
eukprot:m.5781 g.5781  ORF g.5781 m.5781 type:complete len:58 (+) comp14104_c0_seq2:3809-3982(+)